VGGIESLKGETKTDGKSKRGEENGFKDKRNVSGIFIYKK
jgi:hypothetical protein